VPTSQGSDPSQAYLAAAIEAHLTGPLSIRASSVRLRDDFHHCWGGSPAAAPRRGPRESLPRQCWPRSPPMRPSPSPTSLRRSWVARALSLQQGTPGSAQPATKTNIIAKYRFRRAPSPLPRHEHSRAPSALTSRARRLGHWMGHYQSPPRRVAASNVLHPDRAQIIQSTASTPSKWWAYRPANVARRAPTSLRTRAAITSQHDPRQTHAVARLARAATGQQRRSRSADVRTFRAGVLQHVVLKPTTPVNGTQIT